MKTLLSGIFAGALALGLVACGNGGMGTSGAGGEAGAGGGWGVGGAGGGWGVGGAGGVGVGGAGGVGSGGAGSDIGAAPFVLSGTYPLAAGKGTDKLVSGDFDGDGVLDAAFLTTEPDAIQILRGKGGGVLEYATTIPLDESVSILYAIHADADGKLDLVGVKDCFDAAACSAIWTMRGHGDGTFLPPLFSGGEGWFSSSSSDTGDVDGDGDTDIATGIDSNNGGALLRNAGDGKFVIEWSGGAYDLALTDLDEDGILDYVGVDYDWISVLLGNGDGTYQYPGTYFAPDARVHQVVAGDLDADGDEDFVTLSGIHDVSGIDDIIMLFLGAGDGKSFITNELHLGYKHHASPLLADFDGDQDADLALASDGKIIVLYSEGGTFVPGPMITGFSASSILAVDMNGDAKKDLLVGSATGVTVLLNAP